MSEERTGARLVYTVVERGERSFWVRIGTALASKDGSIHVKLDALPVNGKMQIRELPPRDTEKK